MNLTDLMIALVILGVSVTCTVSAVRTAYKAEDLIEQVTAEQEELYRKQTERIETCIICETEEADTQPES